MCEMNNILFTNLDVGDIFYIGVLLNYYSLNLGGTIKI